MISHQLWGLPLLSRRDVVSVVGIIADLHLKTALCGYQLTVILLHSSSHNSSHIYLIVMQVHVHKAQSSESFAMHGRAVTFKTRSQAHPNDISIV